METDVKVVHEAIAAANERFMAAAARSVGRKRGPSTASTREE